MPAPLPFRKILHPTDRSASSHHAFHHALRLALAAEGDLRVLHASARAEVKDGFPQVKETLVAWGFPVLDEGDLASQLGATVTHLIAPGEPLEAILAEAAQHPPELMVLATHGRDGIIRLLSRSVAEPAARGAHVPTLFLPPRARGFVTDSGRLQLQRILVPVHEATSPDAGTAAAARLACIAGENPVSFRLLHIGDTDDHPELRAWASDNWSWERATRTGAVVPQILAEAEEWKADVIVMPSAGHDSASDVLLGSTAERVVREATCPVLVVPNDLVPAR